MKSIGSIAKYTLLAIWIIAIALTISIGIKQASAFAAEGRVVKKETITINPTDTLYVKFKHNDYYAKSINEHDNFKITQDSLNNDVIYSNEVSFKIERTDQKLPYLQIEKEAKGNSLSDAKKRAQLIQYSFKIDGNQIILDNYLLSNLKDKYRDQEVTIILYLPEGTLFKTDTSVQDYDRSDDAFFNLHYSSGNYLYRVMENKVQCLDCPTNENEYDDVDTSENTDTTITSGEDKNNSIVIDKNGVTITSDSTDTKKSSGRLRLNKDGIIIKSN